MNHYVYAYLDTRKFDKYIYNNLEFDYEPFYIGQGTRYNGKSIMIPRIILQYSLDDIFIKEYNSIISASIETNIHKNAICNCCRKVSKTSGGFKWKYK